MRKQGYRESTITYTIQALRSIAKRTNILDPESAKAYLASASLSESRKEKLTDDLARSSFRELGPYAARSALKGTPPGVPALAHTILGSFSFFSLRFSEYAMATPATMA